MNEYLSNLTQSIKERLKLESDLYLTTKEKNESNNLEKIKLSLLDEPFLLITVVGFSLAFDRYKHQAYSKIIKNLALHLLLANTFYYLVLTDYGKFYKKIFNKLNN
jgi:hypothetical protein